MHPLSRRTILLPELADAQQGVFLEASKPDVPVASRRNCDMLIVFEPPTQPPAMAAGASPVGVRVDPLGRFVYVANQDDNTVSVYTMNSSTGVLTPATPPSSSTGDAFDITIDPTGRFAYVPNNIVGFVSEFTIDSTTGMLTPTDQSVVTVGIEPTSVAVDPSGMFAYVVDRQSNSVSAYSINQDTGDLTLLGTATTGSEPFRVTVDPSDQFVYVTNEGSNTVSFFAINHDGTLRATGSASTGEPAYDVSVVSPK